MRFLFRLDLSLHAGAGNFIWNFEEILFGILNFATKQGVILLSPRQARTQQLSFEKKNARTALTKAKSK